MISGFHVAPCYGLFPLISRCFPASSANPRDMECNMSRRKNHLPIGSTLASAAENCRKPTEFVRSVFANMAGYHKDSQVRLALDSNPRFPDYLIEMLFSDEEEGESVLHAQSIAVFSGKDHVGALTDEINIRRPWSSEAMSYTDVRQLLGRLRGILPSP